MWICPDLGVSGQQRHAERPRRRYDDLIGWIAVELARELRGTDCDCRSQMDETDAWVTEGQLYPIEHGLRQGQATDLDEFGDLPARDRANGEPAGFVSGNDPRVLLAQASISVHPPNPDMRVEDDHREASQSSAATGSVGSS